MNRADYPSPPVTTRHIAGVCRCTCGDVLWAHYEDHDCEAECVPASCHPATGCGMADCVCTAFRCTGIDHARLRLPIIPFTEQAASLNQ